MVARECWERVLWTALVVVLWYVCWYLRLWLAKDVVQDKYKRARVGALGSRWAVLAASSFTTCWADTARTVTLPIEYRHVEGYIGAQYQDLHDTSYMHLQATLLEPSRTITAYITGSSLRTALHLPVQCQQFQSTPYHRLRDHVKKEKAANTHIVDTRIRLLTTLQCNLQA